MKKLLFITLLVACEFLSLAAFTSFKNSVKKASNSLRSRDTTVSRPLAKIPSQGGLDGISFDDINEIWYAVGIRSINLTHTDRINSISVTYILSGGSTYVAPTRGKPSGVSINITFPSQVYISKMICDTNGSYISQIVFQTLGPGYDERTYGPYGKPGNASFTSEIQVIAFYGTTKDYINSIGVYGLQLINRSQAIGGKGGSEFDDELPFKFPAIVGILSIRVWSGVIVDGIQTEYLTFDKGALLGAMHGNGGSQNMSKITLSDGEKLELVEAMMGVRLVDQLTFTSRKADGSTVKYGPYGQSTNSSFTCSGSIIGFLGSAGDQIDRLGIFFVGKSGYCKNSP